MQLTYLGLVLDYTVLVLDYTGNIVGLGEGEEVKEVIINSRCLYLARDLIQYE